MSLVNNHSDPALDCEEVTPSDSTEIVFRALYVGSTGDVAITSLNGNVVTFVNVPDGFILPVHGKKVMATNTDAEDIVALK